MTEHHGFCSPLAAYMTDNPRDTYFFRVYDSSMAGVDIRKGDIAVIDCARTAKHGDVILADVDGLLTIRIWEEGLLVSINTARVEHHISEYANVRMIGVVLTIFRRLFK